VPICPPQIPSGLLWGRNQAFVTGSRFIYAKLRLTFYGEKLGCLRTDCRGESYAV